MKYGIDVIVPTFKGESTILRALTSLVDQTANKKDFSVIVVTNGPADKTKDLLAKFGQLNSNLEMELVRVHEANAARARNAGLAVSERRFVTFLDDDDFLSPKFIESALANVRNDRIEVMGIRNFASESLSSQPSELEERINDLSGSELLLSEHPWLLGFNAAKVVPRTLLENFRYQENLESGEDVVFFASLLSHTNLKAHISSVPEAFYGRVLQSDSVSRQVPSFNFCVEQRLQCISELQKIHVPRSSASGIQKLIDAQFRFVTDYLVANKNEVSNAQRVVNEFEVSNLSWSQIPREDPERLVISYCFPPFNDPSAVVAAKRIRAAEKNVDVISCDMSRIRSKDETLLKVCEPWIFESRMIKTPASFADWDSICSFARTAARQAQGLQRKRKYKSVYSRALWSGSHLAAAIFKLKNPNVKWEAEFSDPLRIGASGCPRDGELRINSLSSKILDSIIKLGFQIPEFENHFGFIEFATFVLADELVFTNVNQLEVMLESYDVEVQSVVRSKAKIKPHPILPKFWYQNKPLIGRRKDAVKLAYFGNFYGNRGLECLIESIHELNERQLYFQLDIYSNSAPSSPQIDERSVRLLQPLKYLDFLKRTSEYDVLVVNDAQTAGVFPVNPFLPSKLADYKGAGKPVLALVEENSTMSQDPHLLRVRNEKGELMKALGNLLKEYPRQQSKNN